MAVEAFGIEPLSGAQYDLLARHYSMMCRWNRRINLTRIIDPDDAARFHYAESLFGARFLGDARTVLDIGSGAGFPGVPLAVLCSDVQVTALEANNKKALFLNEVREEIRLANFAVLRSRIEQFDCTGYDLLTCRALDRAEDILPPIVQRLSPSQRLMLYCSRDLIQKLAKDSTTKHTSTIHQIPQTSSRIIAMLSRE
jgi:16S rRNA (guanine527-N7)-methyltransferase